MSLTDALRDPWFYVVSVPLAAIFLMALCRIGRPFGR